MNHPLVQDLPSLPATAAERQQPQSSAATALRSKIALLTGCQDRPYALGLAPALAAQGISLDFIGSNEIDGPELHSNHLIRFLNLRGEQDHKAGLFRKTKRILAYYFRLCSYAFFTDAKVFHLLWNDKFELFDRTLIKLYYRLLGRRLVLTAHNVNVAKRDGNDSWFNRFSLKIQYRLVHHIFVHTEKMKTELMTDFAVPPERISVIPLGLNETAPNTSLTAAEARCQFGLEPAHKTMLFFGRISPYKGLEFLIEALASVLRRDPSYRLIIAGPIKGDADYWHQIQQAIKLANVSSSIIQRIGFIPDDKVEVFFKAADVLLLPYTHVFQSGLLSLGYSFGLPIIACDVGSLKADILDGQTGFVCQPQNSADLARTIEKYFSSDLYRQLPERRPTIRAYACDRFSWAKVGRVTKSVYSDLLS
jgi:glycosyltransferase involved in cell wall biosynthesis